MASLPGSLGHWRREVPREPGMPRRRTLPVLLVTVLMLAPLAACGGSTGGIEEASDYLYSCLLQVTNATSSRIASFEWILVERRGDGDVLWGALGRNPSELWDPGLELSITLGPNYADLDDPSRLEWEVTFVDDANVHYGPWTVPLAECGSTSITVTPADAN